MADSTKAALVKLGFRVREYCPVGELLPGMAYLVRRLLENTSNEGFLALHRTHRVSRDALLQPPGSEHLQEISVSGHSPTNRIAPIERVPGVLPGATGGDRFQNEPPTDFTLPAERERLEAALARVRLTFGARYPLMIDHRPIQTPEWLPSVNPANREEAIGYAAQATLKEAEAAVTAAVRAALAWARTDGEQRAGVLRRLANLLGRHKAELTALEVFEAGKNWIEADADVAEAIDFCRFYAAVLRDLTRPQTTQDIPGESNIAEWRPRGTGLVIAPWNFPLAILTGMTTAALVTGNTVVMKPSDQTPVLAARLMEFLIEAGLPAGVVNLVSGPGVAVGAHLVAHPRIDFIAFTGSKEVGLSIWESAGKTRPGQAGLKKVICEMGGKNALIVDDDADLDEAVAGVVASAFGYAGQKCSALSRLILLAHIHERFVERLIAATSSLPIGPAEQPGTVIGPVISAQAQARILAAIESGRTEACLAWQGHVPNDPKAFYVPPSIFVDVPPASRLFQEEIFGPVLSVTRANDFEHALTIANTSAFALTGGVYSRDPAHIELARREFICGNLYINRPITGALVERQPFGGFKMSGGGTKAGGREYLEHFMIPRVITENLLRRGFAPARS